MSDMDQKSRASIEFESCTENLSQVREFMSEQVRLSPLSDRDQNKVVLAVDEAVANIIKHAYQQESTGSIVIEVTFDAERFEISVLDSGNQFDPNDIKDVDIMKHVKEGRKTGLGIFIMRQIMDEVQYNFREGERNELHMVKYVQPADPPASGGAKGE